MMTVMIVDDERIAREGLLGRSRPSGQLLRIEWQASIAMVG